MDADCVRRTARAKGGLAPAQQRLPPQKNQRAGLHRRFSQVGTYSAEKYLLGSSPMRKEKGLMSRAGTAKFKPAKAEASQARCQLLNVKRDDVL